MKYVGKLYGKVGGKYFPLGGCDENSVMLNIDRVADILDAADEDTMCRHCVYPGDRCNEDCVVGLLPYLRGDDGEEVEDG